MKMRFIVGKASRYLDRPLPFHEHKESEVIVYFGGTGTLHIDDRTFAVEEGMIALVPPNTKHRNTSTNALQAIFVRGDFNHLFQVTEPLLIRGGARNEGLLLAQLLLENQHEKPDYAEALGNALSHYILNHMNIQNPVEQAVSRIVQELIAQYNDPCLSVTDLLNQSGYAEDYIRACFKRTVGSTPNGYLTVLRIRHACQMIDAYKTVIPLSEVAEQSGYLDYVNFCRRFKQVMGISPQQYKNKTQLD